MDLEYRKQWDRLVITLEIVERDQKTGNEVIRWVTHYPVRDLTTSNFFLESISTFSVPHVLEGIHLCSTCLYRPSREKNGVSVQGSLPS